MTRLTNFKEQLSSPYNNNLSGNYPSNYTQGEYFVQEPLGKRPFPPEFDLDMEYAPKAKRRFDKISSCLENFSISSDAPMKASLDSSSEDDEMEDVGTSCSYEELDHPITSSSSTSSSPEPVVIEPDDEPATAKKIRLDESLQKYLINARDRYSDLLPRKEKLKGNELMVWRPTLLVSPKNDFNMEGRITEIDDEEEERVKNSIKKKIIDIDGMLHEENDYFRNSDNYVIEQDSSDGGNSDIGSSWNSPVPSPPSSQIVEIEEDTRVFTPNSLTNGSVSDEEMMELDD